MEPMEACQWRGGKGKVASAISSLEHFEPAELSRSARPASSARSDGQLVMVSPTVEPRFVPISSPTRCLLFALPIACIQCGDWAAAQRRSTKTKQTPTRKLDSKVEQHQE